MKNVLGVGVLGLLSLLGAARGLAQVKVGVLLKGSSPFWMSVDKGAKEAGEALGVTVVSFAPTNESETGMQVRFLSALEKQQIQALVIAPSNPDVLKEPVARLAAQRIRIVSLDSPMAAGGQEVFIATDHTAYGTAEGELLAKLVQSGDQVAIFRHNQSSLSTKLREQAAVAALRRLSPDVKMHMDFFASSEPGTEKEKAHALLEKHAEVKAVLAIATPGSMGMLAALREKKLAGTIKLVGSGFNLTPEIVEAIEAEHLHGWAAQLPREIGYKGVETAVKLLKGETVPAELHPEFFLITKENLREPRIQALLKQ
jgi:ribose transport system substrate-binding protein